MLRHRDDLVSNYRTVSVPDMCRFPLLWRELDHLDGKTSNRHHMPGAEKNHHQFHKAHDFLESLRKESTNGHRIEGGSWVDDFDHRWEHDIHWI